MKKLLVCGLATTILTIAMAGWVFADVQTDSATATVTMQIDEIAVLNVTGNPGTLTIIAPGTGGATPSNPSDDSTYLQYTSTVPSGVRQITAGWEASDTAPAGCSLKLEATPSGGTNEGSTAGQITVSSSQQAIITGIGSCATGTLGTDGAQLTYTLSLDTMTSLIANESQVVTITFILTDSS